MLDKRLQLGGLQVGGPRTTQNSARFRVANNVYQTRDDYMIPRYHGNVFLADNLFTVNKIAGLARYEDGVFSACVDSANKWKFYTEAGAVVPIPPSLPSALADANFNLQSCGPQFIEKLGCLFVGLPYNNLLKYDGAQIYQAGVPLPKFGCAQYAIGGATFIRIIQHHLDFQGNNVNSGYVQFPATPAANNVAIRVDSAATDLIGSLNVVPTARPVWEVFDGSFDEHYYVASAEAVNAGANEVVMTTGGNHNVAVGAYILVSPQFQPDSVTNLGEDSYAVAMKVKAFDATTVTLDLLDAKFLDMSREWQSADIDPAAILLVSILQGVNYWLSVWSSNAATGAYVFKGIVPALYNSTAAYTQNVDVSSPTTAAAGSTDLAWNLAPVLGDIYDVTSSKGVLPRGTQINPVNSCFSTYGDLMLMSYKNEIYFSDTTLGGAFEMINGVSFIVVGEGDDGNIQTVCGTSDYMMVSRQYKNYYLSGNLPTANYRVQEISETSLGGYSNESSLSILDKIILFNKQGIWAIYSGGRCEEVSFNIRGFFDNSSNTTSFDEESFFDIDDFGTYVNTEVYNQWMRMRLDVNRNLLFFLTKGDDQGQLLVLNLNNGEFYTWSGLLENYPYANDPDFTDMVFIDGSYYVAVNYDNGNGAAWASENAIYKENKVIPRVPYDYMGGDYNPLLKTTWFTAGEPSLEKKTKQLKLWGIIVGDVAIEHAVDWAQSGPVDDGTYTSSSSTNFSHKKRMESANALACSVSMEFEGDRFELEGLEMEWEPFQMGMKR